ncbi:hypothetical protein OIU77_028752 [Salix suchowensis]|uniref:DM2 domain-containing protein n=1 Tax=Salix suchowensis TaxID=1278906 RepID=A0ABQ9BLQ4_9ROSI|nr:hypothetical protein OIU77_028752 [Salix suchowensis]
MAISSGIFSTFVSAETVPLLKYPSPTSTLPLRLLAAPPANPRMILLVLLRSLVPRLSSLYGPISRSTIFSRRHFMFVDKVVPVSAKCSGHAVVVDDIIVVIFTFMSITAPLALHVCTNLVFVYLAVSEPLHRTSMDPSNKKNILCDEKLKKIFAGRDQVGFLEIAGLISPHFLK